MSIDPADEARRTKARKLSESAAATARDAELIRQSASERFFRDNPAVRSLAALGRGLKRVLGPIGSLIVWLFSLFGKWFRWAAFRPVYAAQGGQVTGDEFSGRRLVLHTGLTACAFFFVYVGLRAIYYYGTYFEETVYVTGKQEIETGELYQFGGCTSLPCSTTTDNGKFYLIESSLFLPVMLYPEENVFANIPQQDGACRVEGYGLYFRSLRWIYKSLQLYQHVVHVSCRPYTVDEIRKAVGDGVIVEGPDPAAKPES